MLDLTLVEPPNYYDLATPASYIEAKEQLVTTGALLREIVATQPDQETSAQLLTAQTMKEIGDAWSRLFELVTDDPANPGFDEARFRWQPGGEMSVTLPDEYNAEVCVGIVKPLVRAAVWRNLMAELAGTETVRQIEGLFRERIADTYQRGDSIVLDQQLDMAVGDIFEALFRRSETRGPVFTEFAISWGEESRQCFNRLYQETRR